MGLAVAATGKQYASLGPAFDAAPIGPALAGISVVSAGRKGAIPASLACGMFMEQTR